MQLPDIKKCFALMNHYGMLPNIMNHSIIVARIAEKIIDDLLGDSSNNDHSLPSRDLVISGALLHDIAKTPCIQNGCDHAALGAEICHDLGYPELAYIVSEHVVLRSHETQRHLLGIFDAREIVYYSDKRVMHDNIVDLNVRLEYIIETYGNNDPRLHRLIEENFAKCLTLEKHLFKFLSFSPEDLTRIVLNSPHDDLKNVMSQLQI